MRKSLSIRLIGLVIIGVEEVLEPTRAPKGSINDSDDDAEQDGDDV